MAKQQKVLCAMSGGVDSSLAAALLLEQGYEVLGATMQLFTNCPVTATDNGRNCAVAAADDAALVAEKLGISHVVFDLQQEFKAKVIDYFIADYLSGRTPNPCIACNRYLKFAVLLQKARELGCDFIATGHYARLLFSEYSKRWLLLKAADHHKNQTYVLYSLTQEQLGRVLLPLADYTKDQVRLLAREHGLQTADRPESQEICFIADNDYHLFLKQSPAGDKIRPGSFVDLQGNVLGKHQGIAYYTIGQRKGLGAFGKKMFVVGINVQDNTVILGSNADVFGTTLLAEDLNWILYPQVLEPLWVEAQIRYNAQPARALVIPEEYGRVRVEFAQPQRAITPGQAVVFYQGEYLVGGGTIVCQLPAK